MRNKGQSKNNNSNENNTQNQMQLSKNTSDKLTYLLVGGGIGAIVALLFAPKSGTELRTDIADATRKGYDRTRDTAQQFGQRSGDYLSTAKQKAGDVYARAGGALNAAKSTLGRNSGLTSTNTDQSDVSSLGELTGNTSNTANSQITDTLEDVTH